MSTQWVAFLCASSLESPSPNPTPDPGTKQSPDDKIIESLRPGLTEHYLTWVLLSSLSKRKCLSDVMIEVSFLDNSGPLIEL